MSTRSDVDAVMAEVRERVRRKRALGIYSDEVDALLHAPLPGGAILFTDELADPLAALPAYLGAEIPYDPRSRRRGVGPLITAARRSVMWLLRWWIQAIVERQDRVNKLVVRALQRLDERSSERLEARVHRLEEEWRRRQVDEVAANLNSIYFASRFSGDERTIRAQAEQFVPLFKGRRRVLDLGSGRGTFLQLMRDEGIGAYGVEVDRTMVEQCASLGLEVYEIDAEAHLRQLADKSIDGAFAAHFAEHLEPGRLIEVLRQLRRVLQPASPIVMATPNVRTVTVGAHTFWLDPAHRRPLPPELFQFYLEVEGFADVEVRAYAPTERRLSEDVPAGPIRDNVRLLNETLFGDRDYAVIGRAPA